MMELDRLRLERRVDGILGAFSATTPGATIGVVQGGALVVHRSAGMASLEFGIPISPATTFRIASVSKQFTCAAVLRLAGEGKLSTSDDIRKYLPELPDLGLITIDMMMRNMSGIRDMLEILRQGGMDLSMPCSRDDLFAAICRQTGTNFPPGERFLYSNSNFLLAGLIVERVSGVPLKDYLQTHFFTPLGLRATRLTPTTGEWVPNLATGYLPQPDGSFIRAPHAFPLGGEGGLVSSVIDLALWDRALEEGLADRDGLTTQADFTNGHPNSYARGLVVSQHRGVRTEDHGGLWPGFRTAFLRAPDHSTTVICIANSGGIDPANLAFAALDAVLDERPGVHPIPAMPALAELKPIAGRYLDVEAPMTLDVAVDAEGAVTIGANGNQMTVKAAEDGRLLAGKGSFALLIRLLPDALEVELPSGHLQDFKRVPNQAKLPDGLDGTYFCADMDATWTIKGEAVAAVGPIVQHGGWRVEGVAGDIIRLHLPSVLFQAWLDIRVQRDAQGAITGLFVNGGRAKGLIYSRK
jgi:D-aminopeptidase